MSANVKDYYKTLGVSPEADLSAIKAAYTGLSKQPSDGEEAKEIKEAFDVLSNPRMRAQYDSYLTKGRPATSDLKKLGGAGTNGATGELKSSASSTQLWSYLTLESSSNYGTTKYYIDGEMQPDLKNEKFSIVVNTLGADGWEMVGIATSGEEKTFVFKRATDTKYVAPKKGPAA